jgi:hypothetical protein
MMISPRIICFAVFRVSDICVDNNGNVVETVGNSEGVVQALWVTRSVIHRASVSTTKAGNTPSLSKMG